MTTIRTRLVAGTALAVGLVAVPGLGAPATAAAPVCHRTLATYPVLHQSDKGAAVTTLQCLLNDDGYGPLTVNGRYGRKTKAAIRELESTFEAPPPRPYRIGRGMWTLIIARTLPDRLLKKGDQGHAVRVLQRALRASGGTLAVDGDFGPQTAGAVKAFQRHNGLGATGKVDAHTRFYLKGGAVTRGKP